MIYGITKKHIGGTVNEKPEWTFNENIACFWNFEDKALDFAKRWFKNFKDWELEEVKVNIYEEIF